MKYFSTEKKIVGGFLFSICCIGFFIWQTYRNTEKTYDEGQKLNTAHSILRLIQTVQADVNDIRSVYSSFPTIGYKFVQKSANFYSLKINTHLKELFFYTANDSLRKKEFSALTNQIFILLQQNKSLLNLKRNGKEVYQVATTEKETCEYIKHIVKRIEAREQSTLKNLNIEKQARSIETLQLFIILACVVFIFLLISYKMIRNDLIKRKKLEEQLRNFNTRLEEQVNKKTEELTGIFERVSDPCIALDRNLCYTYVNEKAGIILDRDPRSLIGKNIWTVFPEFYTILNHAFIKALEEQRYIYLKEYDVTLNSWFENHIYPSPQGLVIFFRDVTDEKKAEAQIILSEKKYRDLFDNNPLPMWLYDLDTLMLLDLNEAAIDHFDYSRDEFLSMSIKDIIYGNDLTQLKKKMDPTAHSKLNHAGIWKLIKSDRTLIDAEITLSDFSFQGKPARLVLANDITQKLKAEEELKESQQLLRELSSHLQRVREEERTTIAREIHDELGQQLTALKMDVAWVGKKNISDAATREKVSAMMEMIDETFKTVRRISSSLRPGLLDDLGLVAAIEWQITEFAKRTGIVCKFNPGSAEINVNSDLSSGMFRVLQEALTNIARHAQATDVFVYIDIQEDNLILTVKDNGAGFNPELVKNKKTFGLLGMKERAKMFNGELYIFSEQRKGTTIIMKAPVKNQMRTTKQLTDLNKREA